MNARELGVQRQAVHGGDPGTSLVFAATPDLPHRIGAAGELAFAERYHLSVDRQARLGGDGGTDFVTPIGKVEVKTRTFKRRFAEEYFWVEAWQIPRLAPWVVFARYEPQAETARLVGWTTNTVMRLRPMRRVRDGLGPYHWITEQLLCPMNHLACGGLVDYAPDAYCCAIHTPRGNA